MERLFKGVALSLGTAVFLALPSAAQELNSEVLAEHKVMLDTVWTMVAAFLVFWMNAGFALVESGFCRKENTVNILTKNFIVFAISALAYWFFGFAFMFGDGNTFLGLRGFMMTGADNSPATRDAYTGVYSALNWTGVPLECKFFFQLVFAGTAATIVSGAVAERIKFQAYLLFSFLLVALIYPVTGHWIWGVAFSRQEFFMISPVPPRCIVWEDGQPWLVCFSLVPASASIGKTAVFKPYQVIT